MKQKIEGGWELVDKILTACGLDVNTGFEVEKGSVYCLIQDEIKKAVASERQRCVEDSIHSFANYLRDHYWDSLEKDRDLITLHVDAIEKNYLDQAKHDLEQL